MSLLRRKHTTPALRKSLSIGTFVLTFQVVHRYLAFLDRRNQRVNFDPPQPIGWRQSSKRSGFHSAAFDNASRLKIVIRLFQYLVSVHGIVPNNQSANSNSTNNTSSASSSDAACDVNRVVSPYGDDSDAHTSIGVSQANSSCSKGYTIQQQQQLLVVQRLLRRFGRVVAAIAAASLLVLVDDGAMSSSVFVFWLVVRALRAISPLPAPVPSWIPVAILSASSSIILRYCQAHLPQRQTDRQTDRQIDRQKERRCKPRTELGSKIANICRQR
jgi:hypothetical protein